jgi:uncharacterized protein YndB with AHSA1/START domain
MTAKSDRKPVAEHEITLVRIFDAPRELVWRAWTEPKHLAAWWGPRLFTNPICEIDARPGGAIRILMRGPGMEHMMDGVFREIAAPERIVFTSSVDDGSGNRVIEGHNIVTFENHGTKTKMTLIAKAAIFVSGAEGMLEGMETGWSQSLDKLAEHVAARS